jgi:hypothetical protein
VNLTSEQLMLRFRREVADTLEGVDADNPDSENLWKNASVYEFMDEAHFRVAEELESLYHQFEIAVTADEPYVNLPAWVIEIRAARLTTAQVDLHQTNLNSPIGRHDDYGVSATVSSFHTSTGTPRYFVRDAKAKRLRLSPIPTADDTLELYVTSLPRYSITDGSAQVLFTHPREQRLMLHYMKYLAYGVQDADGFDPKASEKFYLLFEKEALERAGEIENMNRVAEPVAYGGL